MSKNELSTFLEQVEKEVNEMYERLIEEYKVKWNVTEELKKTQSNGMGSTNE